MANAKIYGDSGITEITFEAPVLVADLLGLGNEHLDMPCGKQGRCGKCRVSISGALSTVDGYEAGALTADELAAGVRLACRCRALGDVEIHVTSKRQESILTDFKLPHKNTYEKKGIGLAVDIGTTTVAAYLYDLEMGEALANASAPNPQRSLGADVTSRLKASLEGKGEELKVMICDTLSMLLKLLLEKAGKEEEGLLEAVVTGNTAMLYLLTGRPVESIAYPPFEALTLFGEYISGDAIGLCAHTRVWLPHCISAYVGADITCAMLYASYLTEHEKKPLFLVDVGTNGEMAMFDEKNIYTCSTAAGPAFEGAGIRFGATAGEGAINYADLTDGIFTYKTIGGKKPTGICGTGLIDTISVLLKAGAIDETGYMEEEGHILEKNMVTYDGMTAFRYPDSEIYLTQADVRAVQLAKAAVCAGMLTLVKKTGLDASKIETLQIAGGFGSFIRAESAENIGLMPQSLATKAYAIGNGAGAGAVMMLLSDADKEKGAKIVRAAETVELASSAVFSDNFIACMGFE